MKEIELYEPIKAFFSGRGYNVDGEVGGIDILCMSDNDIIAIELKNDLNLKLITQAALRQKMFSNVYAAVWSPKNLRSKAFQQKVYLLQRMGIGLILVTKRSKSVCIYQEPKVHDIQNYLQRNQRKRKKITNEMQGRRLKTNSGGIHQSPILTAYKEDALIILDILVENGPEKAAQLKKLTGIEKSYNIVYHNPLKWFEKLGNGLYGASELGVKAHEEYSETIEKLRLTLGGIIQDE